MPKNPVTLENLISEIEITHTWLKLPVDKLGLAPNRDRRHPVTMVAEMATYIESLGDENCALEKKLSELKNAMKSDARSATELAENYQADAAGKYIELTAALTEKEKMRSAIAYSILWLEQLTSRKAEAEGISDVLIKLKTAIEIK